MFTPRTQEPGLRAALLVCLAVMVLGAVPAHAVVDSDGDGIPDDQDNCPAVYNPDQAITITLPGDINFDGAVTVSDVIYFIHFIYYDPTVTRCWAAFDVNCSGTTTTADIIYLINYMFRNGPEPCDICLAFELNWKCE